VLIGSALSGKKDSLAERMGAAHQENPLSYTFLGPSGVFVKEFSERFARHLDSAIPRGNFLVIDQFAGKLFGSSNPDMVRVDEHLLNVLVSSILSSASQDDIGTFYPLKDSLRLAAFAVEAIRDAKDDGEAHLMDRLANDQSRSLLQFVLRELEARYSSNLFDTFDAYRNINTEDIRSQIKSRFGDKLFLDGFTNLSIAQMIFLSKIIPLFEETYMTLDPALMDPDRWNVFKKTLVAQSIEILEVNQTSSLEASIPLERLLVDRGPAISLYGRSIRVARYKDPEEELIQVCRQIKKRIVDEGMEPGDIAIVLNNFSERAREFSRKLEEYGIPVRVTGEEPLLSSIAVQLLILPFKAALAGYPPQVLLSMLDHGLGSTGTAEFDLDCLEALATGAGLYMGPRRASLQDRREEWKSKLDEHLVALKQRLEILKQDESVYDSELQAQELEIQLCQDLMQKSEELFQSLERIEATRPSQVDLKLYEAEMTSGISLLKDRFLNNPELESEVMAIGKFEHILGRLEVIASAMGKRALTLAEFMAFMEILLSSEEFRPSLPLANTAEILSLHSARFKYRPLKFIVNFNDGIFPSRRTNPLYTLEDLPLGEPGYYKVKEREQKEALYSCLSTSTEVIITYPVASREGEPIVPSLWLDAWSYDETNTSEEITAPMSAEELGIEFGFKLANGEEPIAPESKTGVLAALKLYVDSEFSWKIGEKAVVDSLVGSKFSYTKLSDFTKCPFKFFLRRILGLEETSVDLYELSPLELGSTYHAALKSLYDLKQEGETWDQVIKNGQVKYIAEEMILRFLSANKIRSLPAVREAIIGGVTSTLHSYLEFELNEPQKACIGRRTLTELPFSLSLCSMSHLLARCAEKYGNMIFHGRIDRIDIDVLDKKQRYDLVLSDYKSGSAGDWDQLKLYSLALLCLDQEDLTTDPKLLKSFFRLIRKRTIANKLDALPHEGRMDLQTRPKSSLSFLEIDSELVNTLDRIYEQREFLPGRAIDGMAGNCYFCGFKRNCEPLLDLRGGSL
jgi:ATP-dependent helicase/nuclease subunit B